MKRLVSILLCALLLIGCLTTAISAAGDSVPFIVATDLHYSSPPQEVTVNHPGVKYYCAGDESTLTSESNAIIRQFLREAAASDARFLLLCGDLTNKGTRRQHTEMAQILREFTAQYGKQVFVIDGNHDFYDRIPVEDFRDIYHASGYDQALEIDETTCSYTADLTDSLRLLALDTCEHGAGKDGITPELLAWAQRQAERAKKDGKRLIAITHHNCLEHIPMQSKLMSDFIIDPAKDMKTHFLDWGVRYVFSGHTHAHDIKDYTDKSGRKMYEILTTSLSGYPCAYRTLTLSTEGLDVKTVMLQGVDRADLPQSGYTDELLTELTGDLQTYAKGSFRQAFGVRKEQFFGAGSMRRILARLGGEKLQGAFDLVFPAFAANLALPIYAKDAADGESLERIANEIGLHFRQTDDRDVTDTLYFFATILFYGDGDTSYNDDRIVLFTQCVYTALYAALRDVSAEKRAAILSDAGTAASAVLPYTAARVGSIALEGMSDDALLETALLIASPFIELFSKDNDDLPDGDVFLPDRDDAPETFAQKFLRILRFAWNLLIRYITDSRTIWSRRPARG